MILLCEFERSDTPEKTDDKVNQMKIRKVYNPTPNLISRVLPEKWKDMVANTVAKHFPDQQT